MKVFSALVLTLGALTCVSASAIVEMQRAGNIQYMGRQQALEEAQTMDSATSLVQSPTDESISAPAHGVGGWSLDNSVQQGNINIIGINLILPLVADDDILDAIRQGWAAGGSVNADDQHGGARLLSTDPMMLKTIGGSRSLENSMIRQDSLLDAINRDSDIQSALRSEWAAESNINANSQHGEMRRLADSMIKQDSSLGGQIDSDDIHGGTRLFSTNSVKPKTYEPMRNLESGN